MTEQQRTIEEARDMEALDNAIRQLTEYTHKFASAITDVDNSDELRKQVQLIKASPQ